MSSKATRLPTQTNVLIPLLDEISNAGGCAKPGELYDRIAQRLGLNDEQRQATIVSDDGRRFNAWERQVRWTRQTCVAKGLIENNTRGVWELTDRAQTRLKNIVRGTIVTIFSTDNGFMCWANAEDIVSLVDRESIQLILTSPPYPLIKPREYQVRETRDSRQWVENMLRLFERWQELLTPTGSVMLNVGSTWNPGEPSQSLHVERLLVNLEDRLGFRLCQRLDWHSPAKPPVPLQWLGIRHIRVKPSVEPILWLSQNPSAVDCDNRRVLKPYSKSALRAIANPRDGMKKRPSGLCFGPTSFQDRGGAIPPSLIVASNSSSNDAYRRAERAAGRTPHPATMPDPVADFCIRLASREGDTIFDPYGGKNTTGLIAERLGRRWITADRSLEYITSAQINFTANGVPFQLHHAA